MANPLYSQFSKKSMFENNQIMAFMKEIQDFQKTFNGNPQEEVQQMLNDGRISQKQFNEFAEIANQIMAMMPKN